MKKHVYLCSYDHKCSYDHNMNQDRIIYKIAKAYYENNFTQQEIANKYSISRMKVSRMLATAIQNKIVQIKIASPSNKFFILEHKLEVKYGLKEVIIADTDGNDNDDLIESIGGVAAGYLNNRLLGNEIVALTWGRTLFSMVNALSAENFPKLQVVQMLGGLGEPEAGYHGADLTRRMAQNFSTKPRLIHAPGIVRTKDLCRELINDIQVKSTLKVGARADLAIVGLGLFGPGSPIWKTENILTEEDKKMLTSKNIAGDISLRFFNDEGQYITSKIDDRIVGLSSDQIKRIPRIIGVAGGEEKYRSIRAVLKGSLIHVLITDKHTAEKLAIENI